MGPVPLVAGRKYSVAPAIERAPVEEGGCAERLRVTDVVTASTAREGGSCAAAGAPDTAEPGTAAPDTTAPPPSSCATALFFDPISREISGPVSGPRRYDSAHRL